MDRAREGSLMHFFRLADNDAEESMSTALLRCLFRNLMFYQANDDAAHLRSREARQKIARVGLRACEGI